MRSGSAFQIGGAVVLAVVTAVVTAGGGGDVRAQLGADHNAVGVVAGVALLGLLVTALGAVQDRRTARSAAAYPVPDYPLPAHGSATSTAAEPTAEGAVRRP